MKKFYFIIIFIIIQPAIAVFSGERGVEIVDTEEKSGEIVVPSNQLNKITTFQSVIPQNTYVFLVGNNKYIPESGYQGLDYCHDDTLLMKQILIQCCKVEPAHIFLYQDMTYQNFKSAFNEFLTIIEKESRVIIYYSGHGNKDGALVFTDGNTLTPSLLRNTLNSFSNDTILILDACYSGQNDVPFDLVEQQEPFKENCIRIYASLANLTAKEITYENPYFKQFLPFYKDVLNIENIRGNGYFTALVGQFFAQYKFKKKENISFSDLVYNVTNKGKAYTEILATTKGEERKGAVEEFLYRINQYPKLHPMDTKISFRNIEHEFLILQKDLTRYRPEQNHLSFLSNTRVSITLPPCDESLGTGIMSLTSILYNFYADWGIIGCGLQAGAQWSHTIPGVPSPYDLLNYTLAIQSRYYADLSVPLYFLFDLSAGIGMNQIVKAAYSATGFLGPKFYVSTGLALGINLKKDLGIALTISYSTLIPYEDFYHLLSPGIEIVWNFKILE